MVEYGWWFFETCQDWFLLEICSEHWIFLCVLLFPLPFFFAFLSCHPLLVSEKGQKGDWSIWARLATSKAVSSIDIWVSFKIKQPLGRLLLGLCFFFFFSPLGDVAGGSARSQLIMSPCQCVSIEIWKPHPVILTVTFFRNAHLFAQQPASMYWGSHNDCYGFEILLPRPCSYFFLT